MVGTGETAKEKFNRKKKNAKRQKGKGATSARAAAAKRQRASGKGRGRGRGRGKGKKGKVKGKKKNRLGKKNKKKKKTPLQKLKRILLGSKEIVEFSPGSKAERIVEMMGFENRDLVIFKEAFEEIDIDLVGEIDYSELLEYVGDVQSPYTDALFSLVDPEGTGILGFEDFFQLIATYSMYSQEDISRFAFTTFDKDSSGTLDEDEFVDLCKTISNASPMFPANFKRALEDFDKNDDGLIDYNEFKAINRTFPMVLYPVFKLQQNFWEHVLGDSFWKSKMVQMRREEQILEYQKLHAGALPPTPLKTVLRRSLCCCIPERFRPRTDQYEVPTKKKKPKKRRKKGGAGGSAKVRPKR
eukprot:g5277.t1